MPPLYMKQKFSYCRSLRITPSAAALQYSSSTHQVSGEAFTSIHRLDPFHKKIYPLAYLFSIQATGNKMKITSEKWRTYSENFS